MTWLPHFILLTGTAMAATMGFALTALVIINAFEKSSKASDSTAKEALAFFSKESTEWPRTTVRGYDTPELWREDAVVRGEYPDENYFH
jgi:hypothetical protein